MWTGSCRRSTGRSIIHFWILWQWNSLCLQCFLLILVFQKLHKVVDVCSFQLSVILQNFQETAPLGRQSISKLLHHFCLSCRYSKISQLCKQMIEPTCHVSQGLLIHACETVEFFLEQIMTQLTCCFIPYSSGFQTVPQLLRSLEADKLMIDVFA
ncbi:hypothetical protein HanRHA438_Chr10g0454731 [Helianthus annuus]|nr:hypothetical protein HanRHA438_Chr10g0454731 [Helianthus annuus]